MDSMVQAFILHLRYREKYSLIIHKCFTMKRNKTKLIKELMNIYITNAQSIKKNLTADQMERMSFVPCQGM